MNNPSVPLTGERTRPTATPTHPMWAVRSFQGLTTFFWLAVVLQTFLAGAMIFAGGGWREAHIAIGHLLSSLPLIPLAILIFAFLSKLPARDKGLAGLLLLLTILQPVWLYMRGINILFAAIHPVNALLLFALPLYLLMRVRGINAHTA
jgi:hypothetical protein